MFKRVVRRALDARKGHTETPKPPPTPAAAVLTQKASVAEPPVESQKPAKPKPQRTSIAARIAAGPSAAQAPTVSATSGALHTATGSLHSAADGASYWGPVDNECSRAKAQGDTLTIDQLDCISCGTCVENTDAVFVLPDDAKAVVLQQHGDMTLIQDAIDACPVTCIHWEEDPDTYEQLNDAEGRHLNG
jgi:ferredoxin